MRIRVVYACLAMTDGNKIIPIRPEPPALEMRTCLPVQIRISRGQHPQLMVTLDLPVDTDAEVAS
jgi:hypothetical protein